MKVYWMLDVHFVAVKNVTLCLLSVFPAMFSSKNIVYVPFCVNKLFLLFNIYVADVL